ncbi:single-stranded-DNA-specific exonuclease RecJ [Neorickettsia helminthoeca str. Oregon]|uniref:Single-stranded-DNA-specific exonuclease RecJ n=1 Tax=Neorickettsia helminthoeca str. Oregon TaxID=1286528 RepID=X5HKM8_9RICK|nr:single-stranded-DNA-specific exonuclease RecJ [Neorickettsia helminthoeca]AHX11609.1 single-stranded-DNA-specific exonuclease RecJ [Neorickettsia helminthoeca str. Oregon]
MEKSITTLEKSKVSVKGAIWSLNEVPEKEILFIKQKFGLSSIVASVLYNRVETEDDISAFLDPKLRNTLPDPFSLLGVAQAVERILEAIKKNEKIVIYGDYDVDGATSSALIKNYLRNIGKEVSIYIPDRITEGYGPNSTAFTKLREEGYTLCITVDCGILAHKEIESANSIGLDIIVVDHHISTDVIPPAVAVINPNRIDQPHIRHTENLAAVGVSFLLIIGLNATLRATGFFDGIRDEPNLINYLDLVALGTVCDIVKLTGINRALVKQGLKVIDQKKNLGLSILIHELEIYTKLDVYHLGYIIGPHINAGGRISKSSLGSTLLSTNDVSEATEIARILRALNLRRKEIEKTALQEAITQIENTNRKVIMVASKNWHQGIIGIVASRIKDRYHLPTIIVSIDNNIGKASARSIKNANIGTAVIAAKEKGLIIEGGGHRMAAGFSCEIGKIPEIQQFFEEHFKNIDIQETVHVDGELYVDTITYDLYEELKVLAPCGPGNPEPRFVLTSVRVVTSKIIGEDGHIACTLRDIRTYKTIRGIAFHPNSKLTEAILNCEATRFLVKVKLENWQSVSKPQVIIEDAWI